MTEPGDSPVFQDSRPLSAVLTSPEQATALSVEPETLKSMGIYGFDSVDPRSRSFNLIRSKIIELHSELNWRTVGVVSATPQVGKSFISANLAASLSRNPKYQTYLLDLDLRRGSVSALCGIENGSMRQFLEESPEVTHPEGFRFDDQRLVILPTRPKLTASAELLAGARANALFQAIRASGERDLFIVDLPPVFANDDAAVVMDRLDGYILVAEEGKTNVREIKDASAQLGTEKLAGVILNKYRGGMINEGYGIGKYYAAGY
jgi:Mrp family chromosome partitioning ATPase